MVVVIPDLWLCLSTFALGALVLVVLTGRLERRAVALPAAPGLPLLGHALTLRAWAPWLGFRRAVRGDLWLLGALLKWSEQYGGAFQLRSSWLGRFVLGDPRVVVVLSDPPAVHALLALGEDAAVKSRRYYSSLDQVLHSDGAVSSATASSSPQWLLLRRSLLHAFSTAEVQQDFEVAKVKALSLARIVVGLGPGVILDVDDAALRLSLDVAGLSKLGYDFQAVEATGEVLMLRLLGEVAEEWDARRRRPLGRLAPWLSDAAAAGQTRCRILQAFIEKELWGDIAARGPPPADDVTLAAQLARLRSPASRAAASLPLERTLSELAAQLLLAHEPTGHAIAWALGCLAAHRAVQDKLVQELRREGVFDDPLSLTYDVLPKLPYLDCVVRETLRLYPTMAFPATVRALKKDVDLRGRRLLAGSEVWVDVFSMHRSPRLWREPRRFMPERWATATATAAAAATSTSAAAAATTTSADNAAAGDPSPPGSEPEARPRDGSSGRPKYDGFCTVEPDPDSEGAHADGAEGAAEQQQLHQLQHQSQRPPPGEGPGAERSSPSLCNPEAYMPFSAGPRSCLGQRVAVAEIKAALAVLLCFLVFEPSGEDPEGGAGGATTAAGMGLGLGGEAAPLGLGLFLRPRGGLHLLVAPRKRKA